MSRSQTIDRTGRKGRTDITDRTNTTDRKGQTRQTGQAGKTGPVGKTGQTGQTKLTFDLTFQVTSVRQLSQFLLCFLFASLSMNLTTVFRCEVSPDKVLLGTRRCCFLFLPGKASNDPWLNRPNDFTPPTAFLSFHNSRTSELWMNNFPFIEAPARKI